MATPRPFNAPTEFKPNISPLGEVSRQVERMKSLSETAPKAGVNPMQWLNKYMKGVKVPPSVVKGVQGAGNFGLNTLKGAGMLLAGRSDGSERLLLGAMATSDLIDSLKPAATAQPPKSIGGLPANYKETEQKAGQTAEDFRPGAGFTGSGSGRDAEPPTKNPNNIDQKGTIMGRSSLSMKDAQEYVGKDVQIANPFLSNALPGTNDDGYSYGDAVAMGANPAEAATVKGGGEVEVTFEGGEQIETKMVQGSPNLVLSGTESAAPSDVKTNDINDPSTWDENYARRRAFLDADSSMAGLKAVQAQKGIVKAGNTFYMNTGKEDEKGNPVLNAIEGPDAKKDVRAYMNSPLGAQGAEDLKNKYIDKIINKTEEEEDNK